MNNLDIMIKDKINSAAEGISPRSSITERAEKRLTKTAKKRKGWRIAASVCLAAVMCGTAVSAVKFGWIDEMLGQHRTKPLNPNKKNGIIRV